MNGPWKRLTLGETGHGILVNTALFESVRLVAGQTRLYPQHATLSTYLWVREPFELVVAMLTEQVDDADAKADIAYLIEAYNYGQFADDMLDHPSPDCRSPCKPLREVLRRHLDRLTRE